MGEFEVPEQIVCLQWQSPVMPVSAFECFHIGCYSGQAERLPNGRIRYVPIHEVGVYAVCSGCWQDIRHQTETEKEK
jgi:hypothetical protein